MLNGHTLLVIMKKKMPHASGKNRQLYRDYYLNQTIGTMPVFATIGHGLAQTIGGLFKCFVMPLVAPAAKQIGKQILGNVAKTGMEVGGDRIGRRNIKETLKGCGLTGIKIMVAEIIEQSGQQQPPAKKKKKMPMRKRPPPKRRQKGGGGGYIFED